LHVVDIASKNWTEAVLNHLLTGGIAAIPTDTLYGLAASAGNPVGVQRLFEVKDRSLSNPIPLLFPSFDSIIARGFEKTPLFANLARAFWPGPLTMVLRRPPGVMENFAPGSNSLALRAPNHPVVLRLLEAADAPIAVTSANRSGEAPCRSAGEVEETFSGVEDLLVVRGGRSPAGGPSTVIDVTCGKPALLRAGLLPFAEIEEVFSDGNR